MSDTSICYLCRRKHKKENIEKLKGTRVEEEQHICWDCYIRLMWLDMNNIIKIVPKEKGGIF